MMEGKGGKGPLKKGKATRFSKETQDMLKLMMQQSKLTHLQRKKINESFKTGATSPLTSEHTAPDPPTNPKTTKYVPNSLPCKPQRRSAEACRLGNSYVREKYHPGPTSVFIELNTETWRKRRRDFRIYWQQEKKSPHLRATKMFLHVQTQRWQSRKTGIRKSWMRSRREDSFWQTCRLWVKRSSTSTSSTQRYRRGFENYGYWTRTAVPRTARLHLSRKKMAEKMEFKEKNLHH
ncbi:UPF0193 protein EVG1 isoform 3-T3 [Spinachia spinachia]